MASYKVIQDIEAEDKLIGPLTFRQFIYALFAVLMLYISFLLYVHHAKFLDIASLPLALVAGFLAFPFGKDQPTEVWAIARLRFLFKPRRRIWAQSGVKELVTITVPKKIEVRRTDGLTQTEVKSRLQALANTIDSRGWAVKNVNTTYQNPLMQVSDSDRLVTAASLPTIVPDDDVSASDDWFDEQANPIAQQVGQLLEANDSQHRQRLIERLNNLRSNMQSSTSTQPPASTPQSGTVSTDNQIEQELKTAQITSQAQLNNMHALRNKLDQSAVSSQTSQIAPQPAPVQPANPVIMNLSKRDDLNVSVISHEADRAVGQNSEEVLVSLH